MSSATRSQTLGGGERHSSGFEGTARFELRGCLGSGGFGEVFQAYDKKLKTVVALKTLHRVEPAAIYRFKQEFRSLADIHHPNLVELYELLSEGERWFFTMELVEGREFRHYARGGDESYPPLSERGSERLRSGFRQLAAGLCALHDAGKLHRDVKPSNILVGSDDGRVVLLDFGLATDLPGRRSGETTATGILGTPGYLSPEQAAGGPASAASDWYAAGVMLYEVLTGERPFTGTLVEVLRGKQERPAPSPRGRFPELPADLCALCEALLERRPERRPRGREVLDRLGSGDAPRPALRTPEFGARPRPVHKTPFVGRRSQRRALRRALASSRAGTPTIVVVDGSSGIGKTELVRRFLGQLRRVDEVVLLEGRCYERESVPYKALDALIDALCGHLIALPGNEAEALLPADVVSLARVFPALLRVGAVARARRRVQVVRDLQEQKRRARTALRELLAGLAARRPIVLYVDDLQWGDRESAELMSELFQTAEPLPVLLILCCRREEVRSSSFLRELLDAPAVRERTRIVEVAVDELALDEAAELAHRLLDDPSPSSRALALDIARESAGSPFFVAELVRYAKDELDGVQTVSGEGTTLARLLGHRLGQLSAPAGRLLLVVAVAGRPLDVEVAFEVAELTDDIQSVLAALGAAKLVRIRRGGELDEIETYHDRIREFVVESLEPEVREGYHLRLAATLEASGRADYETLAAHYREAGDRPAEARFLVAAAERAGRALAFDRAARLYRSALDLEIHSPRARRRLEVELGDALRNAGRGAEAARAYLAAVPGARATEAVELRRRAAEQQMMSGHIDEGLQTARRVLRSVGLAMPRSPAAVVGSLLAARLRLALRGLRFAARDESEVPREQLIRIDVCRSVASGLGIVDPLRGMDFNTRHLLLALAAGEGDRVARALSIEAGFSAAGGTRTRERTQRLLEQARALAESSGNPYAVGLSEEAAGLAAYLECRALRALAIWERAEKILRERCTGVAWELGSLIHLKYRLLIVYGRLREAAQGLPEILKDFRARGDLYGEASLRGSASWFLRLAADQPAEAEAEIRRARSSWRSQGFHLQHYLQLVGRVEIALYRGDGAGAWQLLEETWPAVVRSQLLRVVELTRTEALHLRCRGALAGAVALGPRSRRGRAAWRIFRRSLRRLARQPSPWARPLTRLVEASRAAFEGRHDAAIELLASAAAGFDALDMGLYAAVGRRRRGELVEGEDGRRLIAAADAWMAEQGVKNVERMTDALAPGAWG